MGDVPSVRRFRNFFRRLPADPRCKMCAVPFGGRVGRFMSRGGYGPWPKNPAICANCYSHLAIGGVEAEMTLLFADIRGSTTLAETITPTEFTRLLNDFYRSSTAALLKHGAFIDKLVGDEVVAFFVPGFAGKEHAKTAVRAAEDLVKAAPAPVGVGVHTGVAFVGAVGHEGQVTDFTCLGDNVNVTARLAAAAGPREVLISAASFQQAGLGWANLEERRLHLKGRTEPIDVHVMKVPV